MNATTTEATSVQLPCSLTGTNNGIAGPATLLLADHDKNASARGLTVGSSDLSITVKNGVATLSGYTDSAAESNMAEYLVSRLKGVDTVINLIISRQIC